MLKISQTESGQRAVTLHLEGRIVGPWVDELRSACDPVLCAGRTLCLYLADVEYMDAAGIALLAGLHSRGAIFVHVPPFITAQLKFMVT